jgi:hypothetical protein
VVELASTRHNHVGLGLLSVIINAVVGKTVDILPLITLATQIANRVPHAHFWWRSSAYVESEL